MNDSTNPPSVSVADLEQRLATARDAREATAAEHSARAYDAHAGVPGAAARLAALLDEISKADRRIADLTAALNFARAAEEQAAAERRRIAAAEQVANVKRMLHRRVKRAAELTDAIGAAVRAYRLLCDTTTRARIAFPAGAAPAGASLDPGALHGLVANELYRQGAMPFVGANIAPPALSFPGGKCPDFSFAGQPERIKPLLAAVEDGNGFALAALEHAVSQGATLPTVETVPADDGDPVSATEPSRRRRAA